MKTKIKVIEVQSAPALKNPAMLSGIRDKAAAETWGEKNGYPTVYFIAKKQRVYAEKLTIRVDDKARKIEQASVELTIRAEDTHRVIEKVEEL